MASRTLEFTFLGNDRSLTRTLQKVGSESDKAHSKLGGLGKVAIAGAAGAALGNLAAKVVDFGKESVDAYTGAVKSAVGLRRSLGGTVEDASRLAFAAHETGVEFGAFSTGMRILSKNLGATGPTMNKIARAQEHLTDVTKKYPDAALAASKGHAAYETATRKLAEAQGALGVPIADATGKAFSQKQVLIEVAEQFKNMPDGPNKTAEAMRLFGRSGAQLIPLLNKGKEGLAEFGKEADKLGITVGGKDAAGLKAYTVQQRSMKASFEGLKISLGRSLFPIFTAWSRAVAANAPKIAALAKNELPKLQAIFVQVGRVLGTVVGLLSKSADFFSRNSAVLGPLVKILGGLIGAFLIAQKAAKAFAAIMAVLDIELSANPVGAIVLGVLALAAAFTYAWRKSSTFRDVVTGAFKVVATAVLTYIRISLSIIDAFARVSDKVFGTNFHKSIQGAINGVDRLQQKINHLGDKKITISVVTRGVLPGGGLAGVQRDGDYAKKARALGGPVTHGTSYLVGEHGPEMFTPNGSGYVTNSAQSGRMLARGGSTVVINNNFNAVTDPLGAARQIETMLTRLKRERGTGLGFA